MDLIWKAGWRFAIMTPMAQSVMTSGMYWMQELFVTTLDTQAVSCTLVSFSFS